MAAMSREPTDLEKLSKFDEAIDDSLLNASEAELREDFKEAGDDFDKAVARAGSAVERAKVRAARLRFERAQAEVKVFREQGNVKTLDLAKARRRLEGMRSGQAEDAMMAARKGGNLSERDEQGMLDDLAQLHALENEEKMTAMFPLVRGFFHWPAKSGYFDSSKARAGAPAIANAAASANAPIQFPLSKASLSSSR
jgi:hypothetical protein